MAQDLSVTVPGKDCLVYRSSGASFGSPTWVVIPNIQDLTRSDSRAEANVTGKGDDIGTIDVAYRNIEVTFKIVAVRADSGFAALVAAYAARSPIQLLVLNGPVATVGAKGINADWHITKFDEGQPLDGALTYDVAMKPAKTANAPAVFTVAS